MAKATSYEFSRRFWDFCFANPEKVKPNHVAIYFFAVEHCNRLGWKEKFGLPTEMVKDAIGIKSWHTYISAFNDLVEWRFFLLVERSKNQYSSNIIALIKNDEALDEALDKAITKHVSKQLQSTHQSIDSIDKQYSKPITNNQEPLNEDSQIVDDSCIYPKEKTKKMFFEDYQIIEYTCKEKQVDEYGAKLFLQKFWDRQEALGKITTRSFADFKSHYINSVPKLKLDTDGKPTRKTGHNIEGISIAADEILRQHYSQKYEGGNTE